MADKSAHDDLKGLFSSQMSAGEFGTTLIEIGKRLIKPPFSEQVFTMGHHYGGMTACFEHLVKQNKLKGD